jgi:hypothetical protein
LRLLLNCDLDGSADLAGKANIGFAASPGVSAGLRAKVGEGVVVAPPDSAEGDSLRRPTTNWSPIGRLRKKKSDVLGEVFSVEEEGFAAVSPACVDILSKLKENSLGAASWRAGSFDGLPSAGFVTHWTLTVGEGAESRSDEDAALRKLDPGRATLSGCSRRKPGSLCASQDSVHLARSTH